MKFTSYSDKELEELKLITDGQYSASVISAEDKADKNGADMIVLKLEVHDGGKNRLMNDWLVESFPVKIKHFCYAAGLSSRYENGEVTARDCVGKEIVISIVTKPDKDGKKWNRVDDYIFSSSTSNSIGFTDSELPDLFA
jgi:hypothetical protein